MVQLKEINLNLKRVTRGLFPTEINVNANSCAIPVSQFDYISRHDATSGVNLSIMMCVCTVCNRILSCITHDVMLQEYMRGMLACMGYLYICIMKWEMRNHY